MNTSGENKSLREISHWLPGLSCTDFLVVVPQHAADACDPFPLALSMGCIDKWALC